MNPWLSICFWGTKAETRDKDCEEYPNNTMNGTKDFEGQKQQKQNKTGSGYVLRSSNYWKIIIS